MNKDTHLVISPKAFIRPPYVNCPKCSKNSFGILSIGSNRYSRRCAECYYPRGHEKSASHPLPDLDKKIIYIDQFAISNMMKALNPNTNANKKKTIGSFWSTLFGKLDVLCKLQLIVCPESDFHRDESALFLDEAMKQIYELLSQGVSFKSHRDIQRYQIINSFKIWLKEENCYDMSICDVIHGDINAWQERYYISFNTKYSKEAIDEIKSNRDITTEYFNELFKIWQAEKGNNFEFWYNRERKEYAGILIKKYNTWHQKSILMMLGKLPYRFEDFNPPSIVTTINRIKEMLIERKIGKKEIPYKLGEFLRSESFGDTPFSKISAILYATLANRVANHGRKKPPSPGFVTDVDMISTLLPYCNAMFVDNEMRSLLSEKPLCDKITQYKTMIFSQSNKDEFLNYLDSIRTQASKEHLRAVEEVYGSDWKKPFVEIYNSKVTPKHSTNPDKSV